MAIGGGYTMPLACHIVMVCEFSQIWLNIRNLIGKEAQGLFPLVNSIVFFLAYTFLRIILFPICITCYLYGGFKYFDITSKSTVTQLNFFTVMVFFLLICGLNLFWY